MRAEYRLGHGTHGRTAGQGLVARREDPSIRRVETGWVTGPMGVRRGWRVGSYIRGYCAPKRKPHHLPALCALLRTAGHADGSPNPRVTPTRAGWGKWLGWQSARPVGCARRAGAGAGADRCGRVTRSPHLRGVIGAAVIFTPRRRPIVNRLRLVRPRPDAEGRAYCALLKEGR